MNATKIEGKQNNKDKYKIKQRSIQNIKNTKTASLKL